jgi:hypothetical protein
VSDRQRASVKVTEDVDAQAEKRLKLVKKEGGIASILGTRRKGV